MAIKYMTEDALKELLYSLKQRFTNVSDVDKQAKKAFDEKIRDPLPTDKLSFQSDEKEHAFQSEDSYTEKLKENYGTQARLTDIAPLQTGFSLLSGAKGNRCLGTDEDGNKKKAEETEYSAFSLSNQQNLMVAGNDPMEMKGSIMMLSSGGTAAYAATSDTKAKAKHLGGYNGKESEAEGTEHNTVYVAPDYGLEFRKETTVGNYKTISTSRYAPEAISITAKTLTSSLNEKAAEEKTAPTLHIDGGKIELSYGNDKTTITAKGMSLNGAEHGANTQAAEIARVIGCNLDFYIKRFDGLTTKAGKAPNTMLLLIKDSRFNEYGTIECSVPKVTKSADYDGFVDHNATLADKDGSYTLDENTKFSMTPVGFNDDHTAAIEFRMGSTATYSLSDIVLKLEAYLKKNPIRLSFHIPVVINLPVTADYNK